MKEHEYYSQIDSVINMNFMHMKIIFTSYHNVSHCINFILKII